jgi:hypothetical protein
MTDSLYCAVLLSGFARDRSIVFAGGKPRWIFDQLRQRDLQNLRRLLDAATYFLRHNLGRNLEPSLVPQVAWRMLLAAFAPEQLRVRHVYVPPRVVTNRIGEHCC